MDVRSKASYSRAHEKHLHDLEAGGDNAHKFSTIPADGITHVCQIEESFESFSSVGANIDHLHYDLRDEAIEDAVWSFGAWAEDIAIYLFFPLSFPYAYVR